jgi:hypothetical protein
MRILYLHGFASAGNGAKAQALGERFGLERILSPDLPVDPQEVAALLDRTLEPLAADGAVLVGTSLGGFYADYMSQRWKAPCVLVNPSTTPSQTLGRRTGWHTNLVTGVRFELLPEYARTWAKMEMELADRRDGRLVNLFLAKDDDVLPYEYALHHIRNPAFRCVASDGGHRYESHWDLVMDRIAVLVGDSASRSGS